MGELRQALRTSVRNGAFAATTIAILALGNGATTAIFSLAHGVMLRELPYAAPDRLVALRTTRPGASDDAGHVGAADYHDWRQRQRVFADIALTRPVGSFNLTGAGEPERLQGARVTASLFPTLGARPLLGRTFTAEEERDPTRASRVAVLSHGLWQRRFGGDAGIVGRSIQLNGQWHEVLGVMGPEFRYPSREFELWAPLHLSPAALRQRQDFSYLAVARLAPGVTLAGARAQMEVLATSLAREHPLTNRGVGVAIAPLRDHLARPVSAGLWALVAAVGMVFLIGCANLATLLLARAAGRSREIAIRAALGASRAHLARQFALELLPAVILGAALGLLLARWLIDLLVPLLPASTPRLEELGLSATALLLSTTLSVVAALVVSLLPALRPGALERGPARRGRIRAGLVVAEVAATAVLLVGAGLLLRTYLFLAAIDPGFQADATLSLHLAVSRARHGDDEGVARYLGQLVERVRAVPGVEAVGIVNRLPMGGQGQTFTVRFAAGEQPVHVDSRSINGDYFSSLGIPLLAGRTFNDADGPRAAPVGIIDQRLARELFGDASPIGRRFQLAAGAVPIESPWVEIVGVAGHVRQEGLDRDPRPQVYWPYQQRTQDRAAMTVRARLPPASLIPAVRAAIREVDRDQPIYELRTMREVVDRTLAGNRLNMVLVIAFAFVALSLASVGIYGVVTQLAGQRRREFGIRLALGATARQLLGLVLRQGLTLGGAGLAAGLLLALAATRLMGALLHGVRPLDVPTYLGAAALLVAVVMAASAIPARRAMKIAPSESLRAD